MFLSSTCGNSIMRGAFKCFFAIIVCIILFFRPTVLVAQIDFRSGFIVKTNGDTVKGFVAYRSDKKNLQNCLFKQLKKGKAQSFTAVDLRAYGLTGGKTYEAIILPVDYANPKRDRVFVKLLVQGPLNLYQYGEYFFLKKIDSLFVLPRPKSQAYGSAETLKLKTDKKYVGTLNYLMLDCKMNANMAHYTESDLTKVVYDYNNCKMPGSARKNLAPAGRLNFQLFTGYLNSNLTYDYSNKYIPFHGTTIIGGAGFELSFPRATDKIFFTLEGWVAKTLYQGYYEGLYAGDPIKQDILMDISYVKIPFVLKYNFLSPENTPYVRLGFSWSYTGSYTVKTFQERKSGTVIYSDQISGGYPIKNPKGYWMAIGYDKRFYKKMKVFSEFRYERGEGFIGSPVVNESSLSNYSVLFGMRF